MDYDEIKNAFLNTDSLVEKIRSFCNSREDQLLAQQTPVAITNPQSLLLHIIPMTTFGHNIANTVELKSDNYNILPIYSKGGITEKTNLDGIVRLPPNGIQSYAQVFRDLTHEYADYFYVTPYGGRKEIFIKNIGDHVNDSIKRTFENLNRLDVKGPKAIILRLNGIKNIPLTAGGDPYYVQDMAFDRSRVLLPDVIEDGDSYKKVTALLMESLANAAGFDSIPFIKDGEWTSSGPH